MGCLNCNNELKHTPGKRKKQFCSPDCRVRYWQKNKPKKEPDQDAAQLLQKIEGLQKRIHYLAESKIEIEQTLGKIAEDNIELLAKNAALETKLAERTGNCNLSDLHGLIETWDIPKINLWLVENGHDKPVRAQNKPNTAPKTDKEGKTTPKEQKGKDGTGNSTKGNPGIMHWVKKAESEGKEVGVKPASPEEMKKSIPKTKENKAAELSPFLKSRQNLKNGIK